MSLDDASEQIEIKSDKYLPDIKEVFELLDKSDDEGSKTEEYFLLFVLGSALIIDNKISNDIDLDKNEIDFIREVLANPSVMRKMATESADWMRQLNADIDRNDKRLYSLEFKALAKLVRCIVVNGLLTREKSVYVLSILHSLQDVPYLGGILGSNDDTNRQIGEARYVFTDLYIKSLIGQRKDLD